MVLKNVKFTIAILLTLLTCQIFGGKEIVFAMTSSNYIIDWDSLNSGGTDNSSSTNYQAIDTLGQLSSGQSASSNWSVNAGYRQAEKPKLQFRVNAQNDGSRVDYSAFDLAAFSVTVSSAIGFASGDFIAVVENEGQGQKVAIGEIVSVIGNDFTVDKWSGDQATMSASPAGGDDAVYLLDRQMLSLGQLTDATVATGVAMAEVDTNAESGYTVYITEDHDLRLGEGPYVTVDVSDGTVSIGSTEYGISTTGDQAVGSGDWPISSTAQDVAVSTDKQDNARVAVIYKASIDSAEMAGGVYTHTTSYYCVAGF
ncbi:MAG TPA: hypothetical protein VMX18_03345 [Candidatus Bipolaricaulota bacterium]|nr:hypothetical protein [Candidatus Bipolaricaulota bacterium]